MYTRLYGSTVLAQLEERLVGMSMSGLAVRETTYTQLYGNQQL